MNPARTAGIVVILISGLLISGVRGQAPGSVRMWTTLEGQTLQAEVVSVQSGEVTLRLASGMIASIAVSRLSPNDQAFLKSVAGSNAERNADGPAGTCAPLKTATTATERAPRPSIEKRLWPQKVEVDARAVRIQVAVEDNGARKYVYCSENFEFNAPGKTPLNVIEELARATEGARQLLKALPWGIDPRTPQAFYQAKLYDTRGEYAADANPSVLRESAPSYALYDGRERLIRIPLNFAMQRQSDGALAMVRVVEPRPVIHEVTHQLMHDYLQFLPQWVVEGTAEYTAMLPYKPGVFAAGSHETGLKEYLKTQGRGMKLSEVGRIHDHMRMTREEWDARAIKGGIEQRRLYHSSLLLVYYFSHLDGDKKSTRFLQYFDRMAEAGDAWERFFKDPGVRVFSDGRIVSRIPLPPYGAAFGFEQLAILMDGRTPDQLQNAFIDAYKKIGVQ